METGAEERAESAAGGGEGKAPGPEEFPSPAGERRRGFSGKWISIVGRFFGRGEAGPELFALFGGGPEPLDKGLIGGGF